MIASSLVLGTTYGPGRLQLFPGQLHVHESVVVGDAATGGIRQSGRLSCHRMVVARGAVGTVEQLFLLEVADDLVVGEADLGMLWVAASDVGRLVIGARRTGLGTVNVHTGTDHLVRGDAIVGQRGLGVLSIRRPLIVEGSVVLGADAEFEQALILDRGDGWVIVEGGLGALRVGEDLVLGQLGHALLEVRSPGRIVVDGSVRFEADAPGAPEAVDRHVRLELGPAAEEEAAVIEAAGDVALPALEVVLPDDVPIAAGDTWRLVEAGGSLDLPTPSLPYLPTGLQWQLAVEDGALLASIVDVPSHDGDLDDDGDVDVHDLLTLLQSFGPCPVIDPCFADLDVNGTVDTIDLWLLVLQWG